MDTVTRLVISCEKDPDDLAAWESLYKSLSRHGHEGALSRLVKHQLGRIKSRLTREKIGVQAELAWKPLIDRGFVLFTVWSEHENSRGVLHLARLRLKGKTRLTKKPYPKGWQEGDLLSLCSASPGAVFVVGRKSQWTQRNEPYKGHERPPCQTCLHRLGGQRTWFWDGGDTGITEAELDRLWDLWEKLRHR